jgi:hypothetical protein
MYLPVALDAHLSPMGIGEKVDERQDALERR